MFLNAAAARRMRHGGAIVLLALAAVTLSAAVTDAPPALVEDPLGEVPPDNERMEAYAHGNYILYVVSSLYGIVMLYLIVATGLGSYLEDVAEKLSPWVNLRVAIYAALLTVMTFLLSLPLTAYSRFAREKEYEFANQTFFAWLGEWGKGLLVAVVGQALFFTLLYVALRRMRRSWWVAGTALGVAFLIVVIAVHPVFIAPLFNTFTPLEDEALRADILDLARSQGIPADEVYQVDASRQSGHSNAYVTGILGTQRIVLYDTILKRFAPREIRAVMGHEMGHYLLDHIWKTILFLSLVILVGLLLVDRVARQVIRRRPSLGIRSLADPASMPLMLLILNTFLFLLTPALATYSRAHESEADRFSLEVVGDPVATASAFLKFGTYDLAEYDVHPLVETLLFSHPSIGNRVRAVQEYARLNPESVVSEEGSAAPTGPRTVAILVVDGVFNSELTAPYDILQHIRFHSPDDWPRTFTVSPDGRPVTTFEGLRLTPDHSFATAPAIDILVVPSAEHSMDSDLENRPLIDWVRTTGLKARHVMSLCDGAFVLARAGLLDDVPATTFPADQDRFEGMFPRVELVRQVSFVDAGHALTSVGGAKSFDVALWLVERLYGAKVARGIGRGLVIDWDVKLIPHRMVVPPRSPAGASR